MQTGRPGSSPTEGDELSLEEDAAHAKAGGGDVLGRSLNNREATVSRGTRWTQVTGGQPCEGEEL